MSSLEYLNWSVHRLSKCKSSIDYIFALDGSNNTSIEVNRIFLIAQTWWKTIHFDCVWNKKIAVNHMNEKMENKQNEN